MCTRRKTPLEVIGAIFIRLYFYGDGRTGDQRAYDHGPFASQDFDIAQIPSQNRPENATHVHNCIIPPSHKLRRVAELGASTGEVRRQEDVIQRVREPN